MKILIFFEAIITIDIVWNLVLRIDGHMIGFIIGAISLHYINLMLKCVVLNQELQKWYWWLGIMLSESISFGLFEIVWKNALNVAEVLIVIQCGWTYNSELFHGSGVILMVYYSSLEYFKQGTSLLDLIKTTILLIIFLFVSYKEKPLTLQQAKKNIISEAKLEEVSIKANSYRHNFLDDLPWLAEQRFIVFNERLLVMHQQLQLSSLLDPQIEDNKDLNESQLLNYFFECKCESLSATLLQLFQSPQPRKKAFLKPDIKQICLAILETDNSSKQYFSAGEIESKMFKVQNMKLNFTILGGLSFQERFLVIHVEQQLDKKSQFSKSLHTISVQQNTSNGQSRLNESNNNTISSQLLSNMFQSVSHEFGTYLNCIMSVSAEALKRSTISQEIKNDYFDPIQINSQFLYYTLSNIRDYNTILLNQFVLRLQEFKPKEKINEILVLMEKQLESRANIIELICPDDLLIHNDAERYKQIIYQLISNSARFTENGLIKIVVSPSEKDRDKIETSINDQGIGMSQTEVNKLSEMLKDSKKMLKISRNSVGCGLGLSISNVIAQKMSGKKGITFKSTQNQGSTFTFTVANSKLLYNESLYQTSQTQTYVKVVNETYYLEYPPSEGSIKQMIISGSKYEQSHDSQSYNSKRKPGKNQKQTRFSNRKQSGETQQQFLHRVSEFSKVHTLNLQIDNSDDLDDEDLEKENGNESDSSHNYQPLIVIPSLSTNFKTQILQYNISSKCCPRVLIVDDEIFNIISLQLILSKFSIKTEKALNGADALKKCEERKQKPCKQCFCTGFAVIFLDLNMPVMNGFDTVKVLKQKMQFGLIPKALCIANTGYADLETKRLAIAAGMDFYLTKPFEIKILEDYLKTKFPLNIEL